MSITQIEDTLPVLEVVGSGSVAIAPQKLDYELSEPVQLTAIPGRWYTFSYWGDGSLENPRNVNVSAAPQVAVFSPTEPLESITYRCVTRGAPVGTPQLIINGEFITDTNCRVAQGMEIELCSTLTNGLICYSTDGLLPSVASPDYEGAIVVSNSMTLQCVAFSADFTRAVYGDPVTVEVVPQHELRLSAVGHGTLDVSPLGDAKAMRPKSALCYANLQARNSWGPNGSNYPMILEEDYVYAVSFWKTNASENWLEVLDSQGRSLAGADLGALGSAVPWDQGVVLTARFNEKLGSLQLSTNASYPERHAFFLEGASVSITAQASFGWRFVRWEGDWNGTNPEGTLTMSTNRAMSAVFEPVPKYALIATTLGGGSVSGNMASPYYEGTTVTLTATPMAGWQFLYWKGDASGTSSNLTISMDRAKSVEAVFGTTISTTVVGQGSVTMVPATGPYPYGSTVLLVGTPNASNYLARWGNAGSGSFNPLALVITNANPTVSAVFGAIPAGQFLLTVPIAGAGTVTANPAKNLFNPGETVTLSAVPGPGQAFEGWSGDVTGSEYSLTVMFDSHKTVQAGFVPGVTLQLQGVHGHLGANPNLVAYVPGRTVQLTAVPDAGWKFGGWVGSTITNSTVDYIVGDPMPTVRFLPSPGTVAWQKKLGSPILNSMALATDGDLYAVTEAGQVVALDSSDGSPKWVFEQAGAKGSVPAIGLNDDLFIGFDNGTFHRINKSSGQDVWVFQGTGLKAPPAIGDGVVYAGSRSVYALDAANGNKLWEASNVGPVAMVGSGGEIYTEPRSGLVSVLDSHDGSVIRQLQVEGGSPILGPDSLLVTVAGQAARAYNITTGELKWQAAKPSNRIFQDPTIGSFQSVPAFGLNGSFHIIDGGPYPIYLESFDGSGHLLNQVSLNDWMFGGGPAWVTVGSDGEAYAVVRGQNTNALYANGSWSLPIAGDVYGAPVVGVDGCLFLADSGGTVYAVGSSSTGGLATSPWPRAGHDNANTRRANQSPNIKAPSDLTVLEGEPISLTLQATDPDPGPVGFTYELVSAPAGASINATNGAFHWTPSVGQGASIYTITIKVTDSAVPPQSATTSFTIMVNAVPRLQSQPQSQVVIAGTNAVFTIEATGSAPLSYQWWHGQNLLSVTNQPILTLAGVETDDAGDYFVVVTNLLGSVTSQVAVLTVNYSLMVNISSGGTVSKDPNADSYEPNSSVLLSASPATGYRFTSWSGDLAGTNNPATLLVDTNKSITATFTPIWTLSTTAGPGGTIARDPDLVEYLDGTQVKLTAIPDGVHAFVGWTGSVTSSVNPLILTVASNQTVSANFLPTYTLATSVTGEGSLTVTPLKERYLSGETVQVTATAGAGYGFDRWSGASTATSRTISLTLDSDKVLAATFKPLRSLVVNATGEGTVSRSPEASSYLDGAMVELTATASNGWQFVEWTGALAGAQNPMTITLDADKVVGASFKQLFRVNTNIIGLGSVSLSPSQTNYLDGTTITATAVASAGYRFTSWSGDLAGTNNPATLLVDTNKSITATFTPIWTLSTTAGPGGTIARDPDLVEYLDGTQVKLTAIPDGVHAFVGWTGSVTSSANPLMLTVTSNQSVSANFLPTYTLATSATGEGSLTVTPLKERYLSGETVQVTATAGAGYGFDRWSGASTATSRTISLTLDSDKVLAATFKPLRSLVVNATGEGTVSRSPEASSYLDGAVVELTATASNGWQFVEWTGALAGAQNPITITLDADKVVGASFKQLFKVSTNLIGQGSVRLSPEQTNYLDGTTITATATASAGYRFTGWSGDLAGANNPATLVVDTNKSITATFTPIWTLSITAGPGGTIARDPDLVEYLDGARVSLTAVAQAGFGFAGWSGDVSGANNPLTLTMNGHKNVQARFRDVGLPVVVITSPQPGSVVNENFTLSGTVTDNVGVVSARWEQNGQAKGPLSLTGNQFVVPALKLASGENRIRVLATDSAGNEGSTEVVVNWQPSRILALAAPPEQQEGKNIVVPIILTSQGDVAGMNFTIAYDPNYLMDPSLSWSGLVGLSLNTVNYDTPGLVTATFSLPATAIPAGTNLVANLTLRARSVPFGMNVELGLELNDVSGVTGESIGFGSEVRGTTARIVPRKVIGDNNANNRLDIGDATLIQRLVTKLDPVRSWDVTFNDLNASGGLDSGDVTKVLRVVVGLDAQPAAAGQSGFGLATATSEPKFLLNRKMTSGASSGPSPLSSSNSVPELAVLAPSRLSGKAGDWVTLQVVLTNLQTTVAGATFVLDYPTNALRLFSAQSYRVGALVAGNPFAVWNVAPAQNNFLLQTGRVSLAVSSTSPWPETNGVLAEITFLVQSGASEQTRWPLRLSGVEITPNGYDTRQLPETTAYFSSLGGFEPQPPRFSSIVRRSEDGAFVLTLTGDSGMEYEMQASTNLTVWTPLGTVSNLNGTVQFTDKIGTNLHQRFFRARPVQ